MQSEIFLAVVDATHPFATEVSENIRTAANKAQIEYLRLQRNTGDYEKTQREETAESAAETMYFETNEDCAKALMKTEGNILLTVGSKELAVYCAHRSLRERLIVRVLPSEDSIALCRQQHLEGKQVIAMQGPFSENMNCALIRELHISCLVTKESGAAGGFEEKAAAAGKEGCSLFVIGNPERETGLSFREVCAKLEILTGIKILFQRPIHISLVGIGMGSEETLTIGAKKAISRADYVFGAKRALACVEKWRIAKHGQKSYPYYLAEDMIPVLEEIGDKECRSYNADGRIHVAALFSGDSGFYSGAEKMYQALGNWKAQYAGEVSIKLYPGISAVSYLASVCGVSWQDAKIMSIHGKRNRGDWEAEAVAAIRYNPKVFLLASDVEDVHTLADILMENTMESCSLIVGFWLSYPNEAIMECTPEQCKDLQGDGPCTLLILNQERGERFLAPFRPNHAFIRGKAPMTKAEIRALAICKLKLVEDAVVYDIGSGTGSVAVEIAERSESIRVFAVEQKTEAVELMRSNQRRFAVPNITVIQGKAPEALKALPAPTHVFIGGSGGNLKEIIEQLCLRNKRMRIVITAVTMETIAEIQEMMQTFLTGDSEILQVQVSRAEQMGRYHLMKAENPVMICAFDIEGGSKNE